MQKCVIFSTHIFQLQSNLKTFPLKKTFDTQENGTGKFAAERETQRHAQGV